MSDFIRRDCVASERNKGNPIPEEKHVGKLKLSCSRKLKKKATSSRTIKPLMRFYY